MKKVPDKKERYLTTEKPQTTTVDQYLESEEKKLEIKPIQMQVIREIYLQTPKGKLVKQDQPPSGSQIDRYHELDSSAKSIDDLKKYNDISDEESVAAVEQKTQMSEYTAARSKNPHRQVVHDFVEEEPVPLDEMKRSNGQDLEVYSNHHRLTPSNQTTIQPFDDQNRPEPATILIKDNFR